MTEGNQYEVTIVNKLTDKSPITIQYNELFIDLNHHYNRENKLGKTCFEYYKSDQLVKVHFDYDEELDRFDHMKIQEKRDLFMKIMNEKLNIPEAEWAISDDCRFITKRVKNESTNRLKSKTLYKLSFHFTVTNKSCKLTQLGEWVRQNMEYFKQKGLVGIDQKIYRNGINKFRMPFCKKDENSAESLLIPINLSDISQYHKHLVQIVDYCDEIDLKLDDIETINPYNSFQLNYIERSSKYNELIKDIIGNYNVISTKEGTGQYSGYILHDITDKKCDNFHTNNHNFLIFDTKNNILKLRCHSSKCTGFELVLFEEPVPTQHFDLEYLNNIPIPKNSTDNYQDIKKYIEFFFVYVRDLNGFYRIQSTYNQKYSYMEKDLKAINICGYSSDCYYSEINPEDQKIIKKNFFKRYLVDPSKRSYLGFSFQPYGILSDKKQLKNNDYNLFKGFGYQTILDKIEQANIPENKYDDVKFLLNHIKQYICGLNRAENNPELINIANKQYDYLLYYLANMIQYPTVVPQIILIFFSKINGTGKSGFTKFISNLIGTDLSYFGSYQQIMEKHTHAHVGKLINIIEEVDAYTSRNFYNNIKDFSQRERAVYNEKNKPVYEIRTYVRYIKTTNYDDGVFFDCEDRRYVLFNFDKIYDQIYVNNLLRILDDKYVIYLFGKYLEVINIPFVKLNDWQDNRPLNKEYFLMMTEDPITSFLKDFIKLETVSLVDFSVYEYQSNKDENTVSISKECLYRIYSRYFMDCGMTYKKYKNKTTFIRNFEVNYSDMVKKNRQNNSMF